MYEIKDGTVHTIEIGLLIPKTNLVNLKKKGFKRNPEDTSTYNLAEEEKGFKTTIVFKKASPKAMVYIKVDLTIVLSKTYIDEKDLLEIENRIRTYIHHLFQYNQKKIKITRFDYRIDILVSSEYKNLILEIMGKRVPVYSKKYLRNDSFAPQTIYFNSTNRKVIAKDKKITVINKHRKTVYVIKEIPDDRKGKSKSKVILLYDKEKQLIEAGKHDEAQRFRDILRLEISLRYNHLKYRYRENGENMELSNYLSKALCMRVYKDEVQKLIEPSTFRRIGDAKKIIMKSKLKKKDQLNIFLCDVHKHSLEVVKNNYKAFGLSDHIFRKYIDDLNSVDVNMICLKDNCPIISLKSPVSLIDEYFTGLI